MRQDQPSQTARLIALATVYAAAEGVEPAPSPESVRWSLAFLGERGQTNALIRALASPTGRRLARLVEWAMAPGIVHHFMRRKAWIEEQARAAAALGFDRIVTVAAGFDSLGLRMSAEPGGPLSIEVDHPATQGQKRALIGAEAPANSHFIAADLSRVSILDALSAGTVAGADRATFVIVEGLLMYLDPADAARLVREVGALPTPRLRAVFTFIERVPGRSTAFRSRRRLMTWWLRRHGEPFRSGSTRDEFGDLLTGAGLRTLAMVDGRDLAARWPGPMLEGEVLALAGR